MKTGGGSDARAKRHGILGEPEGGWFWFVSRAVVLCPMSAPGGQVLSGRKEPVHLTALHQQEDAVLLREVGYLVREQAASTLPV
jgi:hypothetical protein